MSNKKQFVLSRFLQLGFMLCFICAIMLLNPGPVRAKDHSKDITVSESWSPGEIHVVTERIKIHGTEEKVILTIKSGAEVIINSKAVIQIGIKGVMKIEKGVHLKFFNNSHITVYGNLIATGEAGNKVKFMKHEDATGWGGIRFRRSGSKYLTTGTLSHCIIESAYTRNGNLNGVLIKGSEFDPIKISDCIIRNNNKGIYCNFPGCPEALELSNTTIELNDTGIECHSSKPVLCKNKIIDNHKYGIILRDGVNGPSEPVFGSCAGEWNDIYGNGKEQPDPNDRDLYNGQDVYVTAHCVYWGTIEKVEIEGKIFHYDDADPPNGKVDFIPLSNIDHECLFKIKILEKKSGDTPEVKDVTITADDELPVHAAQFDTSTGVDAYIKDIEVEWSGEDIVGEDIIRNKLYPKKGSYTIFPAAKTGTGRIHAIYDAGHTDETGIITVIPGHFQKIAIVKLDGDKRVIVGDHKMTKYETLELLAAGLDGDDNLLGYKEVSWKTTDRLDPIDPGPSTNVIFAPSNAGTKGKIKAEYVIDGEVYTDETGEIDVTGPPGLVLLFDTSGSMSWGYDGTRPVPSDQQRLSLAKTAARFFMDILYPQNNELVNFGIAVFPLHPWNPDVGCNGLKVITMKRLTDDSHSEAVSKLEEDGEGKMVAEGNTPLLAGMETAISMFSQEESRDVKRTIVLLSDGYHNCPYFVDSEHNDVTTLITSLKNESIRVFTIAFGKSVEVNIPLLKRLANDTTPPGHETDFQFHDVTDTPNFDPVNWTPGTALIETYKDILVDALGLQAAADPMGSIKGGETFTREVKINEHDKKISFILSWATQEEGRLGLIVKSSDGRVIPISGSGIQYIERKSYRILTVDKEFLKQPCKVGPNPWKLVIDATELNSNETEKYHYSVILDSALKMRTSFDKKSYGTGDTITVTAKITELGRPVTGLEDVYVKVARPGEGIGNWYAGNKVSAKELKQIPEKLDNEKLSPLHRKALYLADIRKVAFTQWTTPTDFRLYDDGTHGDAKANDGNYTNRFSDTVKEGTYKFHFQATGPTSGGNAFDREDTVHKYITVNVSPVHTKFFAKRLYRSKFPGFIKPKDGGSKSFTLNLTPRDALGNYLGPRYAGMIKLSASKGNFAAQSVEDHLDGTYSQILILPESVAIKDVNVTTDIKGSTLSFNLAKKLKKSYRLSLHLGLTTPLGNFNDDYNSSPAIALDFDCPFSPQFSLVGLIGYNHFKPSTSSFSDTFWWNVSANLKYEFATDPFRPYLNGGAGIYIPKNGSIRPGINIGLGVNYSFPSNWMVGLGVDYHRVFTSGSDTEYLVQHVGIIYRF